MCSKPLLESTFCHLLQLLPAVPEEALAADFLGVGEDHKGVRIDSGNQFPQDDSLLLGDCDQKDRPVLSGIHACAGKSGDAAVELMHDLCGNRW